MTGNNSKINAITHFKKSSAHALIASEDSLVIYDLQKQVITETLISKKKSQGQAIPTQLDISHDDLYSIEGAEQSISLRSLKTKQVIAKYEGHLYPIQNLQFSLASYAFVSAANSECMLWNPREQLKVQGGAIAEISQPDKILDQASSDHITHVTLRELGDEKTFMIAVSTDLSTSLYYTRSVGGNANGKASSVTKSKVVKKECTIKTGVNEQIISTTLQNETSISLIHGSVFSMKRSQVKLIDDSGKV